MTAPTPSTEALCNGNAVIRALAEMARHCCTAEPSPENDRVHDHFVALMTAARDQWDALVSRTRELEADKAALECRLTDEIDACRPAVEAAQAERDAWKETAAQENRNRDYYRGLVDEVAALLGPAVFVADDGTVADSPLRAKVPGLVSALRAEVANAQRLEREEYERRMEAVKSQAEAWTKCRDAEEKRDRYLDDLLALRARLAETEAALVGLRAALGDAAVALVEHPLRPDECLRAERAAVDGLYLDGAVKRIASALTSSAPLGAEVIAREQERGAAWMAPAYKALRVAAVKAARPGRSVEDIHALDALLVEHGPLDPAEVCKAARGAR